MDETRGHDQVTGTREELVKELRDRAEGWHHMGSDRKRDRALEAADGLEAGSFSVKVGHTIYSVAGESIPSARDEKADETVSEA